jgi:hypothetical protein
MQINYGFARQQGSRVVRESPELLDYHRNRLYN